MAEFQTKSENGHDIVNDNGRTDDGPEETTDADPTQEDPDEEHSDPESRDFDEVVGCIEDILVDDQFQKIQVYLKNKDKAFSHYTHHFENY